MHLASSLLLLLLPLIGTEYLVSARNVFNPLFPTTTASTTIELTTATSGPDVPIRGGPNHDAMKEACKNGIDPDGWEDFNMDEMLDEYIEMYPDGFGVSVDEGSSFPVYLAKRFGDFPGFICNTEECDSIVTAENCEHNPQLAFLLISLRNFYVWQKSILKAMANQHDRMQDYLPAMVQNYTVHDLSGSGTDTSGIAAAGAVLSVFAALNAVEGTSVIGGTFAGALSMSAGLLGGSEQDAINTLQKEIEDNAKISEALGHARDAIYDSIHKLAEDVLDSARSTDSETGLSQRRKRSISVDNWDEIHNMLLWGLFTSPTDSADYDAFEDNFEKIFRSVIVGAAYSQDQVFIAKASVSIWKEDPCTVDLDDMNDARICIDGTAYVFIRTDDIRTYTDEGDWTNPAGIKELKDGADANGFDLEDIVNSSIWFQDEFGGYGKQPSLSELSNYADGLKDGPPKRLWINLPIIDYDNIHPVSYNSDYRYGNWEAPKTHLLNNCANFIHGASGWPYNGMHWGSI